MCPDVTAVNSYQRDGHSVIRGSAVWNVQEVRGAVARFNRSVAVARKKYHAFLEEGMIGEPGIYKTVRASNGEMENARSTYFQPSPANVSYIIIK